MSGSLLTRTCGISKTGLIAEFLSSNCPPIDQQFSGLWWRSRIGPGLAPRMRKPYGYFIKPAGPLLSSMHTSAGLSFFGVGIFYANRAIAS